MLRSTGTGPRRATAALAILATWLVRAEVARAADPLEVETESGPVRGELQDGVRRFVGIPYAAPPVGALRWRPPAPPTPWTTPRDATKPGASCPQIVPIVNVPQGSEDCLFLNVFTPERPPRRAPVMVWIHGGGFTVGSSFDDDPTRLVAKTGVVAVSLNYRLGPFGFLAHPLLTAEHPRHAAGNLGIEDQQAALRWVKHNIEGFGGDPHDVTIFGESAGGVSVCMQLLSSGTRGLFQRAITESGPCSIPLASTATAEAQGARLVDKLGCTSAGDVLGCLRAKPQADVLNALPPDPAFLFDFSVNWFPTGDGVVLPTDVVGALARGRFHRVPTIVGLNRDEGRLFVALAFNLMGHVLTPAEWETQVDRYFGPTFGPPVRAQYPLASYADPGAAFGQAIGDAILACPIVDSARTMAKHTRVYEYEFVHEPNPFILPPPGIDLGAFHSAELPYVFAGPVQSSGSFTFTPDEQRMVDFVTGAWTRFASRGHPGGRGVRWPRLGRAGKYLVLDTTPSTARDVKNDTCAFWKQLGWMLAAR